MNTLQAPVVWYEVTENTVDGYCDIRRFLKRDNAQQYIDDNPNLNLEGPNVVDTTHIFFEDK